MTGFTLGMIYAPEVADDGRSNNWYYKIIMKYVFLGFWFLFLCYMCAQVLMLGSYADTVSIPTSADCSSTYA